MKLATPSPRGHLLRLPEVLKRYPVSRTSWYDGIKLGLYPEPMRLGKRTVAWRETEIEFMINALNSKKGQVNRTMFKATDPNKCAKKPDGINPSTGPCDS